jgi:hypothetical protein
MNGNIPRRPDDDEGLDRELLQLFDATETPGDAFVASVLSRMQRTRRLRLARQVTGLMVILTAGAFLAPFVAEQTLLAAGWFTNQLQLPATGMALLSPIGCTAAVLLAWGIARRVRNY